MLRHTVFDLDLAFSAGYQIDLRCFLTVNFFTVEKRMEVGHLKRSSSMTKSRLTVSSSRPTEWGSSPCLPRATAARTPSVVMLSLFGHQPKSHYQPKATVRCELIHKHGFGCRFPECAQAACRRLLRRGDAGWWHAARGMVSRWNG